MCLQEEDWVVNHWLRVGPEEIGHQVLAVGLDVAVNLADISQGGRVVARQASVNDHDLFAYNGHQGKGAEDLLKHLISLLTVLGLCLALETVHFVHVVGLVVSPCQVHVLGVEELEGEEGQDHFDGEGATVHKVSIEELARECG